MKTTLLLTAVIASVLGLTTQADASRGHLAHHIDELANKAERQTKSINYTVQRYLLSQRNSKHLMRDVSDLQRLAKHVHQLAHQLEHGRPVMRHLRSDVAQMDREMHHIQDLVRSMKKDLYRKLNQLSHNHHGRRVRVIYHNGHLHVKKSHGHGHGHNNRAKAKIRYQLTVLKRVERMTNNLEKIVHHLQRDMR